MVSFTLFAAPSCQKTRHPIIFQIHNGYIGPFIIYYGVAGAKPMVRSGDHWEIQVPECGYVLTSTHMEEGFAVDKYYYVSPKAWRKLDLENPRATVSIWMLGETGFFVGSREQNSRLSGIRRLGRIIDPDKRFKGVRLSYAELGLVGKQRLMKLTGADLIAAKGNHVDLSGCDLTDATAEYAYLNDASLRRTRLEAVDLFGALLKRADLRGADLRRAQLEGADLRGANLRGANLRGAVFDRNTRWPNDFNPVRSGAIKVCEQPGQRAPSMMVKDSEIRQSE